MRLQLVLSALLWVPALSTFVCTICENGGAIANPNGMVTTQEGQKATCVALSQHIAQLPSEICKNIQSIAGATCGCPGFAEETDNEENETTEDASEDFVCSICGDGEMKNPNGFTLSSSGMPISCQDLHDSRETISETSCARVQGFANIPCGCDNGDDIAETVQALVTQASEDYSCSVCGSGFITNPKGYVLNERGAARTCADLEANRINIPATMCSSLQQAALDACGCDYNQLSSGADESPFVCSICGEGRVLANPTALVQIADGQPDVQCAALEVNAHKFSEDQCPAIQNLASESCGCAIPEAMGTSGAFVIEEAVSDCSICGNGEMTFPSGIVVTPQGKSASCDVLEQNPKQITQRACESIQALTKEPCGCVYPYAADETDFLDNVAPFDCDICEGGQMTNPDGIVTTPNGQSGRCRILAASSDTISKDSCPTIQQLAYEPCGCVRPEPGMVENIQASPVKAVNEADMCHVCGGPAGAVGNPGQMINTPTGMFTCYSIFKAGLAGTIAPGDCGEVQAVAAQSCGCFAETPTASPSKAPFSCTVCGDGKVVTRPDGIIDPSNSFTCAQYEQEAAEGKLSDDQCVILQKMSGNACGCQDAPTPSMTQSSSSSSSSQKCDVCGRGKMVGLPDATFLLPNFLTMSCGDLQRRGIAGTIHPFQCKQYEPFVQEHCGCVNDPNAEIYECPICGNGLRPTNPDGVVVIPTQPDRTCGELMEAATNGDIDENQCSLLHPFVKTACGCVSDTPKPIVPSGSLSNVTVPTLSEDGRHCFSNLGNIQALERGITDTSIKRKYVLCPGKTYQIGVWTDEGEIKNGEPFLALRPNVIYQCGQDGSRTNNCILKGGDFGLASYYEVFQGIHEHVPGVEVRGLTFESQNLFSVLLKSAGDITFTDCAFKGNSNNAPVLLQWEEKALDSPDADFPLLDLEDNSKLKQIVTFQDCVFRDNFVHESMSFPGIIENTFNSNLIVRNCLFENNNYGGSNNAADNGYAIRSFGPLTLESTCFVDNVFLNHGPVLVYGAQYSAENNYVESAQTDLTCELGALFSSKDDMSETIPSCELSDAQTCAFSQAPTSAPTIYSVTTSTTTTSSASRTTQRISAIGSMVLSLALVLCL